MSHYFTNDFSSDERFVVDGVVDGLSLSLTTAPGMFSPKQFDLGTVFMLEKSHVHQGSRILDLCAGYGLVSAFVQKKFSDCPCTLVEINERALALARDNVGHVMQRMGRNSNLVSFFCDDALGWMNECKEKYEIIFLNPPFSAGKKVCFSLIEKCKTILASDGVLYLVAPTKKGAKSYFAHMQNVFPTVELVAMYKGYRLYRACLVY